MSRLSREKITLHTTTPNIIPNEFNNGIYRHILGVDDLWLPEANIYKTTPQIFSVPEGMKDRIAGYFEKYYIQEPDLLRNCHIGAAAISGAGYLKWAEATYLAESIIKEKHSGDGTSLALGTQGVIGEYIDDASPIAYHSVVGIAPGLGIQTDNQYGPLSVVSHQHNLDHYRAEVAADSKLYSIDT
jgi:hypothetical protein